MSLLAASSSAGGYASLSRTHGARRARPCRCTRDAWALPVPSSALYAGTPPSPASAQLLYLLSHEPHLFAAAAEEHRAGLAAAAQSASGSETQQDLSSRISLLRASEARNADVEALLSLQVGSVLGARHATLHAAVPQLADAPLPGRITVDTLHLLLPDEPMALHEMCAHADAIMPAGTSETAVCRLDALSGGRLLAGSIQFGYFLSAVFSATAPLAEPELRRMARNMRTAQAWGAARARTATLWGITADAAHALDDFSTSVTLAPSAAASEFYSGPTEGSISVSNTDASTLPPVSALQPLRPSALRDLVAEAALWGWHLRRVEAEMEADPRCKGLLTLKQ